VAAAVSIAAGLLMPHTRAEDVAHGGPSDAESTDVAQTEPSTA
jgi:hypothetical protein